MESHPNPINEKQELLIYPPYSRWSTKYGKLKANDEDLSRTSKKMIIVFPQDLTLLDVVMTQGSTRQTKQMEIQFAC
jgi:hypothetical protein